MKVENFYTMELNTGREEFKKRGNGDPGTRVVMEEEGL